MRVVLISLLMLLVLNACETKQQTDLKSLLELENKLMQVQDAAVNELLAKDVLVASLMMTRRNTGYATKQISHMTNNEEGTAHETLTEKEEGGWMTFRTSSFESEKSGQAQGAGKPT